MVIIVQNIQILNHYAVQQKLYQYNVMCQLYLNFEVFKGESINEHLVLWTCFDKFKKRIRTVIIEGGGKKISETVLR